MFTSEPVDMEDEFYMLDMKDKYTKRPTVLELSQAFPDCRDVAVRTVMENKPPETDSVIEKVIQDVGEHYKQYRDAKRFLRMTKSGYANKQLNIESARAVKIQDMHDFGKVRKTSKRIQACCPLHEDRNPSFIIYTDSNSWHCFSCSRGGSVIDFIMHLHGKTFIQAVKYLNGE